MITKLDQIRERAMKMLPEDKFKKMDRQINAVKSPGSIKVRMWEDFLHNEILVENLSTDDLKKVEDDIKDRGKSAIFDIINKKIVPENLKSLLRKKYQKELLEVKEILHKNKYK